MDPLLLLFYAFRITLLVVLFAVGGTTLWLALRVGRDPDFQVARQPDRHEGLIPARTFHGRLRYVAGLLSLATAAIHGLVIPEHLAEWWGYGVFFIGATVVQGLYGLWLIGALRGPHDSSNAAFSLDDRPLSRFVVLAGILGNAAIVALYIVTRTVGIPFLGPEAGVIEPITLISVISKLFEVALIACLIVYELRVRRIPGPAEPIDVEHG